MQLELGTKLHKIYVELAEIEQQAWRVSAETDHEAGKKIREIVDRVRNLIQHNM
jgi:hypothetical protein